LSPAAVVVPVGTVLLTVVVVVVPEECSSP
jgi:hypothetical protein